MNFCVFIMFKAKSLQFILPRLYILISTRIFLIVIQFNLVKGIRLLTKGIFKRNIFTTDLFIIKHC